MHLRYDHSIDGSKITLIVNYQPKCDSATLLLYCEKLTDGKRTFAFNDGLLVFISDVKAKFVGLFVIAPPDPVVVAADFIGFLQSPLAS